MQFLSSKRVHYQRNNERHILFDKIADELHEMDFSGEIGVYLRGEPLLDKKLSTRIKIFREKCRNSTIYLSSNGDLLNMDNLKQIFDAGLSWFAIAAYDGPEQVKQFDGLLSEFVKDYPNVDYVKNRSECYSPNTQYIWINDKSNWLEPQIPFLKFWSKTALFGNRAGHINLERALKEPLPLMCDRPFIQMIVAATGKVALCCDDWLCDLDPGDVNNDKLLDIWFNE